MGVRLREFRFEASKYVVEKLGCRMQVTLFKIYLDGLCGVERGRDVVPGKCAAEQLPLVESVAAVAVFVVTVVEAHVNPAVVVDGGVIGGGG